MRYLSVCSGIEAASVAWDRHGFTPVGFSEIDPFPCALLAHHYPHVPNFGDMTQFKEWPDATIDILVGGTPCQSFSVAGLRKGMADPRGNLALTYLAIADRYRPDWLVWENVPGILSSAGGRDFGAFLGGLAELGYGWAYRVLDAQYFGLAQRRRRVFVVGSLRGWTAAAAVLFERESLRGHPAPGREAREGIAAPIAAGASTRGGYRNDADTADNLVPSLTGALNSAGGHAYPGQANQDFDQGFLLPAIMSSGQANAEIADGISPTLNCLHEAPIAFNWQNGGGYVSVDHTGPISRSQVAAVAFSCKDSGGDASLEIAPTLRSMNEQDGNANAGGQVAIAFDTTQITSKANRSQPKAGDPCHPLAAGAHPPTLAITALDWQNSAGGPNSQDTFQTLCQERLPAVASGMQVRRLTPRECERLQGFPDDYTAVPNRGKPAADGPRYKALGNSMAVPCMAWIGERIALVDALAKELDA